VPLRGCSYDQVSPDDNLSKPAVLLFVKPVPPFPRLGVPRTGMRKCFTVANA
jgi:hypothetical protein